MGKTKSSAGVIIEGTPGEIIGKLSEDVANALRKAGIPPTGLHVIAFFHLALSCIKNVEENGDKTLGKMPSYKLLLNLVTRALIDESWPDVERDLFSKEFMEITESLGGMKLDTPSTGKAVSTTMFMAPPSKEVH